MRKLFVLAGTFLALASTARSQVTAASCSQRDVVNALASVTSDNVTVSIPVCNVSWGATTAYSKGPANVSADGHVTYNQNHSIVIQGQGNTTGATSDGLSNPTGYNDQTRITDLVNDSSNATFIINSASGKTFRMTGMSFLYTSSQTTNRNSGIINILGNSHAFRIDHNHLQAGNCCRLTNYASGNVLGVFDHNFVDIPNGTNVNLFEVNGANYGGHGDGNGDYSWADASNFGTGNFMFVENNTFSAQSGATVFDVEQGGRFVFRYNTLINVRTQTHSLGHGGPTQRDRGPRAFEVYKNVFMMPAGNYAHLMDLEQGTSLWWGNTFTLSASGNGFGNFIKSNNRRSSGQTYTHGTPPNGWGYCGTALGPSNWDQNADSSGQACLDGIGRGKGNLFTGPFPLTPSWPSQARDPVYVWANIVTGTGNYWNQVDAATQENRDYFLELPNASEPGATFNGTAGIGHGTLTPTTASAYTGAPNCSSSTYPGPGYWQTSAPGTLWVCTALNTWSNTYYTAFTYPHPLVNGGAPATQPTTPPGQTGTVH